MSDRAAALRTTLVVASRELREHARTPLVWVLAIVAVFLAALAAEMGVQRVTAASERHQQLEEERAGETGRNVSLIGARIEPALRVLRPPQPFSMIVEGQELGRPQYWDFGPAGVRSGPGLAFDHAYAPGTQSLDLEAVMRIVIGLLAVLLAVESISGERVSGTLLALLGQPIRPGAVSAGKIAGATATLAVTIACCALAAIATIAVRSARPPGGDVYLSLLAISAAGLIYAVICLALGMLVSTLLASYRLALTITFVVWSLLALITPRAALVVARLAAPTQVRSNLEADRERLVQRLTETTQRRMGDEYAASLGGPAAWPAKQEDAAAARAAQGKVEPLWAAHITSLRQELEARRVGFDRADSRQRRVVRALLLMNPAGAFTAAASDLAAVGDGNVTRWRSAVATYDAALNEHLFDHRPVTIALVPYLSPRPPHEERRLVVEFRYGPPRHQADMPRFSPPGEDLRDRLDDASGALVALIGYAAVSVVLSMMAFKTRRLSLSRFEQ